MENHEAHEIEYYESIESVCVNGEYVYKKTELDNVKVNEYAIKSAGIYGTTVKIAEDLGFKYYENPVVIKATGYEDNSFIVINKNKEGVVPPKPIDPPMPEEQEYKFDDAILKNVSQATSWQIIKGEYQPSKQELIFSDEIGRASCRERV